MQFLRNTIGSMPLGVLSLCLLIAGCASTVHVDDSNLQQLRNLSYQGIHAQTIQLKNGNYEGPTFDAKGASRLRVQLVEQLMLSGDMTGDGNNEAIVFLTASSGGSGVYTYLAIISKNGFGYQNIASKNLGDRVQVRALRFAEGTLILDLIVAAAGDAACCPSQKMRNTYRLVNGELKQITDKAMGPLSLPDLEEMKWSLAELSVEQVVPADVSVYAIFDEQRLSGSSGCNRYFSNITGSGPYDIELGPVGATRMLCPDPMMQVEDRYLAALQKVSQFGFYFGQLVLGYEENNEPQRLVFNPKPDEVPQ